MAIPHAPLAAFLAALLALPLPALAAAPTYPREVVWRGKRCVERLDADGSVLVDCKNAPPAPKAEEEAEAIAGGGAASSARRPALGEDQVQAIESAATAEARRRATLEAEAAGHRDGAEDADGDRYFRSGVVGGCLLGPLGCLGVSFAGYTSEPTPPLAGKWESEEEERAYRDAYEDELQDERLTQGLTGGIAGIAIILAVIGTVYLVRKDE